MTYVLSSLSTLSFGRSRGISTHLKPVHGSHNCLRSKRAYLDPSTCVMFLRLTSRSPSADPSQPFSFQKRRLRMVRGISFNLLIKQVCSFHFFYLLKTNETFHWKSSVIVFSQPYSPSFIILIFCYAAFCFGDTP